MSTVEEVHGSSADALLADAVDRNFPISIDLRDGTDWQRYPSRFLEFRRRPLPVLCLELPADSAGRHIRLATGRKLVVNFTSCDHRYRFAAAVIQTGLFKLAGGGAVEGIAITYPPAVQRLQRRAAFRYRIPLTQVIVVSLWQGGQQDRDMALAGGEPTFLARLHDISVGGLCVRLYGRAHTGLRLNDLLGMDFDLDARTPLRLDGRVRRCTVTSDGSTELAIQFDGLDTTPAGRSIAALLEHRMAELQQQSFHKARVI